MNRLLSEDGPWDSDTISYGYTQGFRTSLSLLQPYASPWAQTYSYDAAKRLTSLTALKGTYTYDYGDASCSCATKSLIKKLTLPNSAYITNTFDTLGRMTGTFLKNSGGTILNSHTYVYNSGHQRTNQTRTDGSYVNYTYDDIGQLKSAHGSESGGGSRPHEKYGYVYDAAGNLSQRTNNALVQSFGVDSRNQLTNATRSGTLTVAGTTSSTASSVTVNGSSATLYGDQTFAKDGFSLTDGTNSFTAIASDAQGRSDSTTNTVFLPASPVFTYDANGNLTSDSRRAFD